MRVAAPLGVMHMNLSFLPGGSRRTFPAAYSLVQMIRGWADWTHHYRPTGKSAPPRLTIHLDPDVPSERDVLRELDSRRISLEQLLDTELVNLWIDAPVGGGDYIINPYRPQADCHSLERRRSSVSVASRGHRVDANRRTGAVSWLDPLACARAPRVGEAAKSRHGFANLRGSSILCTPHHTTVTHKVPRMPRIRVQLLAIAIANQSRKVTKGKRKSADYRTSVRVEPPDYPTSGNGRNKGYWQAGYGVVRQR